MPLPSKSNTKGSGTLVSQVEKNIRSSILNGEYLEGEKLPSEAKLTTKFGVSRTVIRESIASLRSDGLVEAKQGAGVFVLKKSGDNSVNSAENQNLFSKLELLEFRAPLEVAAAGLAAIRRSPSQEEVIFIQHSNFHIRVEAGKPIGDCDYNFHMAIAKATNNPLYKDFIEKYGNDVFPQFDEGSSIETSFLKTISDEHDLIVNAISNGDADAAKEAMKAHLDASQRRYRDMLRTRRQNFI